MKIVVLMSGGIDSPVAAYLLAQNHEVILFHMDNRPFTDDRERGKVEKLVKKLREAAGKEMALYTAPHGAVSQAAFAKACTSRYQCVLCKRMMLRTAQALAKKLGADAIGTGESLGQVASQTLQNMYVEESVVDIPVLRPLLGLDKTEIMEIAREIGTYEISVLPAGGCTAVPSKPSVKAELEKILEEEEKDGAHPFNLVADVEKGLEGPF